MHLRRPALLSLATLATLATVAGAPVMLATDLPNRILLLVITAMPSMLTMIPL